MKSFKLFLVVALSWASLIQAQIPLSRQAFRKQFSNRDFAFDLAGSRNTGTGTGGSLRVADIDSMPALSGEGVSSTLFSVEPCGINLPHIHPRATEFLYVIEGDFLRAGFVEENGGRTIINDIKAGDVNFY